MATMYKKVINLNSIAVKILKNVYMFRLNRYNIVVMFMLKSKQK